MHAASRNALLVGLVGTLAGFPPTESLAVDLGSLVSPGPLIEAHARETSACEDCHERFDRSSQKQLCLGCHEAIALDVASASGLHGRLGGDPRCSTCHTEHQGARADIGGLSEETFDHARTDFELTGGHEVVACEGCHPDGSAFRRADTECAACHGKQDPHEGSLGTACGDCHAPGGWREIRFDHATTRFPLESKHADTACVSCHPTHRFEQRATTCVSCHRAEDAHHGSLGDDCAQCHDPRGWQTAGFDHDRDTRFQLRGRHATTSCERCHASDPRTATVSMECGTCHALDDDHHGQRGARCESCHDASGWSPSHFDHARDTGTSLEGAHGAVPCDACHVETIRAGSTPTDCVDCHEAIDVHEGSLGRNCAKCHAQEHFGSRVRFDHDLTGFPLLALHQVASCEDCHATQRYAEAKTDCAECHALRDIHDGGLGRECSSCHNPNGWNRWVFDHGQQTDFSLTGGHEGLACATCHRGTSRAAGGDRYTKLSGSCRSCHLGDSPHDDAYGRDCERCHVDTSWQPLERRTR